MILEERLKGFLDQELAAAFFEDECIEVSNAEACFRDKLHDICTNLNALSEQILT